MYFPSRKLKKNHLLFCKSHGYTSSGVHVGSLLCICARRFIMARFIAHLLGKYTSVSTSLLSMHFRDF